MLDIEQITSFYPENLQPYKKNLLREYLQFKILEAIYDSEWGGKLVFMGGTAIHLVHGNTRFSEDLDFDNVGLNKHNFTSMVNAILTFLKRSGYKAESRNVFGQAFRSYMKFSDVLFQAGLSGHRLEKLNIQIDTEPQKLKYEPEKVILNKFDVFTKISVVPADLLLSQKLHCILARPRPLGRDFYDAVFLFGKTQPNIDYLKDKIGTTTLTDLKDQLIKRCSEVDLKKLVKDIDPFLYEPGGAKKILHFCEFIKSRLPN